MSNQTETTVRLFKTLGDGSRLVLLNALLAGPLTVHELAEQAGLADPTASFHLAKLAEAGLVSVTRAGQSRCYALIEGALDVHLLDLVRIPDAAVQQQEARKAAQRQKVLSSFIADGQLRTIPAQRKKRLVVLEALAATFEPGRRYPEAEVNALLARWHDDTSTLRRYLVDENMLQRDHGVYWRPD